MKLEHCCFDIEKIINLEVIKNTIYQIKCQICVTSFFCNLVSGTKTPN